MTILAKKSFVTAPYGDVPLSGEVNLITNRL